MKQALWWVWTRQSMIYGFMNLSFISLFNSLPIGTINNDCSRDAFHVYMPYGKPSIAHGQQKEWNDNGLKLILFLRLSFTWKVSFSHTTIFLKYFIDNFSWSVVSITTMPNFFYWFKLIWDGVFFCWKESASNVDKLIMLIF